ncbi:unnamed protein product [Alopecurus aequalis]
MTHRRRPSSPSPVPAHPLEDDDLLHEILLRLPPQPAYLLRASLVSKRWRHLATDAKFLRRFSRHHRKPPLLGVFSCSGRSISFRSTLDPPHRIPPERFSPRLEGHKDWSCLDCRHGRVLFDDWSRRQVVVWDPITDDYRVVAYPPELHVPDKVFLHCGAVLCADGDHGHAHGACHSSPFKVAFLGIYDDDGEGAIAFAGVYSSETDTWCDLLSTALSHRCYYASISQSSTLVGNTLHWLSSYGILEFDLDTQKLAVVKSPPCVGYSPLTIQAEDGDLGFAALSGARYHKTCLHIWEKEADSYGVATYVLRKTAELQNILGVGCKIDSTVMMHYAEDVNAIFLWVEASVYMVQLGSMQSQKLFTDDQCSTVRPFTSFYTEGICSSLKQKHLISG